MKILYAKNKLWGYNILGKIVRRVGRHTYLNTDLANEKDAIENALREAEGVNDIVLLLDPIEIFSEGIDANKVKENKIATTGGPLAISYLTSKTIRNILAGGGKILELRAPTDIAEISKKADKLLSKGVYSPQELSSILLTSTGKLKEAVGKPKRARADDIHSYLQSTLGFSIYSGGIEKTLAELIDSYYADKLCDTELVHQYINRKLAAKYDKIEVYRNSLKKDYNQKIKDAIGVDEFELDLDVAKVSKLDINSEFKEAAVAAIKSKYRSKYRTNSKLNKSKIWRERSKVIKLNKLLKHLRGNVKAEQKRKCQRKE